MEKSPAYQWYPKDILSNERVELMSLAEEGAYRRALDYAWIQGSLPADPVKLSRLIGKGCTSKTVNAIMLMFVPHPNDSTRIISEEQELIREQQRQFRLKQAVNGAKGGRPKNEPREKPNETEKKGLGFSGDDLGKAKKSSSSSTSSSISPDGDNTPPPAGFISLEDNKTAALADNGMNGFVETYFRAGLRQPHLGKWMDAFHRQLSHDGEVLKLQKDYRKHFANWIKYQDKTTDPDDFSPVKNISADSQKNNQNNYAEQRKELEERSRRLANEE